MAGVSTEGGSNKLDVDLNLVPFIDLLSTLVLFLLLTVVWVQVAAIPATVDSKGGKSSASQTQNKLIVTLRQKNFELNWPSALSSRGLPRSVKSTQQLIPIIQKLLKDGSTFPASVGGDDSVDYGEVITALDILKEAGLTQVALSTE